MFLLFTRMLMHLNSDQSGWINRMIAAVGKMAFSLVWNEWK